MSVDNFFRALRLNPVRSQVSSSSMAFLSAIGFVLSVRQSGFLRLSGGSFVQCGRTVFAVAAAVHSFVRSSTAFRSAVGSGLLSTLSKEVVGDLPQESPFSANGRPGGSSTVRYFMSSQTERV